MLYTTSSLLSPLHIWPQSASVTALNKGEWHTSEEGNKVDSSVCVCVRMKESERAKVRVVFVCQTTSSLARLLACVSLVGW